MFIFLLASASALNRKDSRSVWWEGSVCNCFPTPSTPWQRIAARFGAENSATVRVKTNKQTNKQKRPRRWTTTLQSLSPDFSVSFFLFFFLFIQRKRPLWCCSVTSTETAWTPPPRWLSRISWALSVQCCFKSTETVGTIRTSSWRPRRPLRLSRSSWAVWAHTHCACETCLRHILKLHGSTIRNVACFSPSGKVKPHVVSVP